MKRKYIRPQVLPVGMNHEEPLLSVSGGDTGTIVVDDNSEITDPEQVGAKTGSASKHSVWDD